MNMDIFTAGNVSSRVSAINVQKTVERRLEKGIMKPDDKPDRRFDRSDIKRTIPEQPREVECRLSGGEKTLYDMLKDEIERLCAKCEELKSNGNPDKAAEASDGKSGAISADSSCGTTKEKSQAERLYEQIRAYESGEIVDPDKSVADWVKEQMEIIDRMNAEKEYDKHNDKQIQSINNKLNCGQKLTATEKQYLMAHDPIAYQNAQQIENERKYYSKMLCCCRTKDDVNSMRLSCSLSALAELKKLKSGDTESLSRIIQRNAALESELRSFVRKGGYSALPSAAECRKVAADLRKARRYEQEKKRAKEAERKKSAEAKRKAKKYRKNPGDGKQTVSQVLRSPAARKVRRSMAKGAYLRCAAMTYHVVSKRGGLNGRG